VQGAPDPVEYREASRDRWSRAAVGWGAQADRVRDWSAPLARWMIDAIAPQPGQTVLELAAGPGDTGLLAAEPISPGGTLIVSDFAEPMLAVARERAAALGVDNAEFRVIDAESIDLDTASVDAVLCRWGYMLMADPAAALRETRRVLRPLGRVALAAWGDPADNPWATAPQAELLGRGIGTPPDPDAPGMFAFAPPGRIERLLLEAGFTDVTVDAVDIDQIQPDLDAYLATVLDCSRPFADAFGSLDEATQDEVVAGIGATLAPHRQPDGSLRLPGRSLVAVASA
jgi:SAM-dependent methyltransferase